MSKPVKDGEFYVRNRKKQETSLKKDLDGIEGFDVISRLTQKKNPSNFVNPSFHVLLLRLDYKYNDV